MAKELEDYIEELPVNGSPSSLLDHLLLRKSDGTLHRVTPAAINALLGGGGGGGRGALRFDNSKPQSVNCGQLYKPGTVYGNFFCEGWVQFDQPSSNGYAWVDGYGGAHNNLLGVNSSTTKCTLNGKYYGASPDLGNANEGFPIGVPAHIAHGYDGSHYMQWINGHLTMVKAESASRTVAVAGSNGEFYIGGPADHSMWHGKVWRVRLFEGADALTRGLPNGITDFFPERYFRPGRYDGTNFTNCEGCWDLSAPMGTFPDMSLGFDADGNGRKPHHGALAGEAAFTPQYIFHDDDYPTWEAGDVEWPTFVPTAPSTPAGAVVFDSFSRRDSGYAWKRFGNDHTGSTESGSAGPLAWSVQTWPIFDGRLAYFKNLPTINTVNSPISNVDVSVSRTNDTWCHTGLILRYTDANNYVRVLGYPDALVVESVEAGTPVLKYSNLALSTNWTTLRAVINGTSLTVYRDATSFGPWTVPSSTATKHGVIAPATGNKSINRFDDFLIKAAS